MPNDELNLDSGLLAPAPKRVKPTTPHLDELSEFAKKFNLTMGSTTGGTHNKGSLHYSGNAFDVKDSGSFDNTRVNALKKAASEFGLIVRDERQRPKGQAVWGGPHVHIEKAEDDPLNLDSGLGDLDLDAGLVDAPQAAAPLTKAQQRGAYAARATEARKGGDSHTLDKLARDIEWHFGYSTLVEFGNLSEDKQQKIAQLATQYAAEDEVKKKLGIQLEPSPAWKLANQRKVGVEEGTTFAVHQRPEVDAAQRKAWRDADNPLLKRPKSVRAVVETLALGGSGLLEAAAGVGQLAHLAGAPGTGEMAKEIHKRAEFVRRLSSEAQEASPLGGKTRVAQQVGSGVIEFAPLMLIPELGVEGALARIGLGAAEFGGYSGLQSVGREESAKDVAKSTTVGAGTGALLGVPLPGKSLLAKSLSGLAIVGGGTTVINLATGQPLSDAATQGLIMSVLRGGPALLKRLKVREASGELRPATPKDFDPLRENIPTELQARLQATDAAKFEQGRVAATERLTAQRNAELKKSAPLGTIPPEVKLPEPPNVSRATSSEQRTLPTTPTEHDALLDDLSARKAAPVAQPTARITGQEGSATLDIISGGLLRKLNTVRQTISTLVRSRGVRDALAYSRDAGDNQARIFGEQMRNDVEGPMREALGSMPKPAGDALSFVVESQGDPAQLAVMRAKINSSTKATPGWVKRANAGLDFAEANYATLQPIAQKYKSITDAQVVNEQAAGLNTLQRDGYVMHAQDIEGDPTTGLLTPSGGAGESTAFKKVRTHETFADSIAAGVNPKSLNALDLLGSRIARGQQNINRRAWTSDIKGMTDTRTGNPVAVDPITVKKADGTTYQEAPSGYHLQEAGIQGQQVAIHNGYEGIYSALTKPSAFTENAAGRSFMKANGAGKSISLMLDTFHLGRLAFWESLIKAVGGVKPGETVRAPLPSYRKGLTLLDTTPAEINRMARAGEIPAEWTTGLLENKRRIDLLVEHGYNVGGISDQLHQEWIHAVPVIGKFNKWLFSQFQRGAMTEVGLLEYERISRARPEMSDSARARQVAKDLNTRFGNLGRQSFMRSRNAQDLARTLFLAPQWNWGLIKSELGAVVQGGKFIGDVAQGKKIYAGVLLRSVGAMAVGQFAANQLINMYTRGHPTWDNPEEGWGAKVSAYIPDKLGGGPGFFLHPMGLAAETTHLFMKGFERTGEFSATLNDYLRSRASSAMRPVLTFITRRDYLGRALRPGTVWDEAVKSAIPTPIPYRALSGATKEVLTGKAGEKFPGEYQKQIMSSFGIRTESVSGGEQRIRKLASLYNSAHGIERQGEFYEGPYMGLTRSLSHGGDVEALKELLKSRDKKAIRQYYDDRIDAPLTGKKDRERDFLKTLNVEQRARYDESKELRRKDRDAIRELLKKIQAP